VIALAASSGTTVQLLMITFAYAVGAAIPLLIISYGGQALIKRIRFLKRHTKIIQTVMAALMIATAVSMLFRLDQTIQAKLLAKLPSSIGSGLTQKLEESTLVRDQLDRLKGESDSKNTLVVMLLAPELTGITHWLNSPPLTLQQLKGKVVLIDFWTYSCINCIRTLPYITKWNDIYKDQGLVVIGVHSPEFSFEKETSNVARAIQQHAIYYPVAQDNDFKTWNAYSNQYWPAHYLIDAHGIIRYTHFGEGQYDKTEAMIRTLLQEANQSVMAVPSVTSSISRATGVTIKSPETYLGVERRKGFIANVKSEDLKVNQWTLQGYWREGAQSLTSIDKSVLSYRFMGGDVYLVLNPPHGKSASVRVLLDGKVIKNGGVDVKNGKVLIDSDRLYHLVHLPDGEIDHLLTLQFDTGISAFAFTFG